MGIRVPSAAVIFDHHIIGRHQPYRNFDRPTYLGT